MPIQTNGVGRSYFRQIVILIAISLGLGLWGVWDLYQIYRADDLLAMRERAIEVKTDLEAQAAIAPLSAEDQDLYERAERTLDATANVKAPNALDHVIQWGYVSLLLCVPYFWWMVVSLGRQRYELDEEGNLHLPRERVWSREEIRDIDMSRWMRKSVATVVHADGRRERLDAYHHRDMEFIVGALAHRFYPEEWNDDATPVRPDAEATEVDEPEIEAEAALAVDADDAEPGERALGSR